MAILCERIIMLIPVPHPHYGKHSGLVVEHLTLNREVLGLSHIDATFVHICWITNRKYLLHPDMTENLLAGTFKINNAYSNVSLNS